VVTSWLGTPNHEALTTIGRRGIWARLQRPKICQRFSVTVEDELLSVCVKGDGSVHAVSEPTMADGLSIWRHRKSDRTLVATGWLLLPLYELQ
jgi:hypothetical protein